jgi:hypothetical protein
MVIVMILSACARVPIYTLEASLGTYLRQSDIGSPTTTVGTVLVLKLREGGDLPKTSVDFTLTGPTGFTPLKERYPAGVDWIVVPMRDNTPFAGEYQLELSSGLTQKLSLKDASQTLALTTITATLENTTVNVSWESVPGAVGYYVNLFNTNGGSKAKPTQYTLATQAQFTAVSKSNYAVGVYALNFDTVTDNPILPAQVNMSDSVAAVVQSNSQLPVNMSVLRAELIPKD